MEEKVEQRWIEKRGNGVSKLKWRRNENGRERRIEEKWELSRIDENRRWKKNKNGERKWRKRDNGGERKLYEEEE